MWVFYIQCQGSRRKDFCGHDQSRPGQRLVLLKDTRWLTFASLNGMNIFFYMFNIFLKSLDMSTMLCESQWNVLPIDKVASFADVLCPRCQTSELTCSSLSVSVWHDGALIRLWFVSLLRHKWRRHTHIEKINKLNKQITNKNMIIMWKVIWLCTF